MNKGTTPIHCFIIPYHARMIDELLIVYEQDGNEIIRKNKDSCVLEQTTVYIPLTQEETLLFDHRKNVQVQLRLLTTEGVAYSTRIFVIPALECLSDEVIK